MTILGKHLEKVTFQDKQFIGTITFRSEDVSLPDGSKIALGIDGGIWVLVYQKSAHANFQVYKYDQHEDKIMVDQKPGKPEDIKILKKHIKYFFAQAKVEDLVTLLPPHS